MTQPIWRLTEGDGPLVVAAIHDGHDLRPEVAAVMALPEADRLREEDPFTGEWTTIAPTRIVGLRSRFEVDLNRPRDKAVYILPEDAWGLTVWQGTPASELVDRSLAQYDAFYAEAHRVLTGLQERYGRFVVFDLHTYNHRRDGTDGPAADPEQNPEVNLGTGTMERERWAGLIDRFVADLSAVDFMGRQLDVRENVKFRGGNFGRWVHETFPESGCALSIEFKKFFMDEWSGQPDGYEVETIYRALRSTLPGVRKALEQM